MARPAARLCRGHVTPGLHPSDVDYDGQAGNGQHAIRVGDHPADADRPVSFPHGLID